MNALWRMRMQAKRRRTDDDFGEILYLWDFFPSLANLREEAFCVGFFFGGISRVYVQLSFFFFFLPAKDEGDG
jgi:hypothetical protein